MIYINPWTILAHRGRFLSATYTGTIPATEVVTDPSTTSPAVTHTLQPPEDKVYCVYYYNFGNSPFEKLYFALHATGFPLPYPNIYEGVLRQSNHDGPIFLPGTKIEIRLWNVSSPAADVSYDVTVFYFEVEKEYLRRFFRLPVP